MSFVFLTLPKPHHDSLKNFVAINCLPLFVFEANFSKTPHSKSTKDRDSAVPLTKASPWISTCAGQVLGCPQREWESRCLCEETEARTWSWGLSTWQCWGEEQGLNSYLWVIWVLHLSSNLLVPNSPQEISHRGRSLNESLGIKWFWIEEVPGHFCPESVMS